MNGEQLILNGEVTAQVCHFEAFFAEKSLQSLLANIVLRDFSSFLLEMTHQLRKSYEKQTDQDVHS